MLTNKQIAQMVAKHVAMGSVRWVIRLTTTGDYWSERDGFTPNLARANWYFSAESAAGRMTILKKCFLRAEMEVCEICLAKKMPSQGPQN
jgi:hypothetical protein